MVIDVQVVPCVLDIRGRVCVTTSGPVQAIEWLPRGIEIDPPQIAFCTDRMIVTDVTEGEYNVKVTVSKTETRTLQVLVPIIHLPVVDSYDVYHASSDHTRDGKITARVKHMPTGCQYLWTTGVVTSQPVLEDVEPGLYTVCPVSHPRQPIAHLHNCATATVRSERKKFSTMPELDFM